MKRIIHLKDSAKSRAVRIISCIFSVVLVIVRALLVEKDLLICVCAGVACYCILVYILGSVTRCLVVKQNKLSFKMRCILVLLAIIESGYSVVMMIVSNDYRLSWVATSIFILLFAVVVAYNGYISESDEV